jgi:hypothetical protein
VGAAGPDRSLRGTHQASFIAQARHPENEGERVMPLILKNKHDRLERLRNERAQHRFNPAEKERELAIVLRELAEARLELARRDTAEGFANAPSPSTSLHRIPRSTRVGVGINRRYHIGAAGLVTDTPRKTPFVLWQAWPMNHHRPP